MATPRCWKYATRLFAPFLMLLVIACGAAAPEGALAPESGAQTPTQFSATPAPTPAITVPVATPAQGETSVPSGVLNVGIGASLGSFRSSPRSSTTPGSIYISHTAFETLLYAGDDGSLVPRLATDWSVSEDALVVTFKLREGVPFHRGYGELTAEDVIYSYSLASEVDSIHTRADHVSRFFRHENGRVETPDEFTLQVHTGVPQSVGLERIIQGPGAVWIVNKSQMKAEGEEDASRRGVGTGSWEIVDDRSDELWKFQAVQGHWRKTPNFAELVLWHLPEESARLAGMRTGILDTAHIAVDSIPVLAQEHDIKFMSIPDAGSLNVNLYSQWYVGLGTENQRPGYNPDLPWVSSNPDPSSEEWVKARKVREALSLAIDRQSIVDTLLHGYASVAKGPHEFSGKEERLYPGIQEYEYNPDKAQQLLAEAGYPQGFELALNSNPRGAPADAETCDAIADMWLSIGVRSRMERVPYSTFRARIVSRTYEGASCWSSGYRPSPIDLYLGGVHADAVFNTGIEHPWLQERVELALETVVDSAKREEIENEIGRFFHDNMTHITLLSYDQVFPLGPKVDPWPVGLGVNREHLNNFEYAPHRP